MNSHQTLGINAPISDRTSFRKVATCSVVESYRHTTIVKDIIGNTMAWELNLGASTDPGSGAVVTPYTYNFPATAATDGFGYKIE